MENYFKISEHHFIQAKSWADYLFHNAPQTAMYFDKNVSLSETIEKRNQLKAVRECGDSLQEKESLNYFKTANIKSILKKLRPSFNQFMVFAYNRGSRDINSAISPKTMLYYIKLLENLVYEGKITPYYFNEQISYMRILCAMSTATEGLPDINIDKMTTRGTQKVKEYVASAS